MRIFRKRL